MGQWPTLFESNLLPVELREYGEEHEFGPPAAEDQLVAAELALGVQLPAEVREMLAEFNAVWCRTRYADGREYRDELYWDLKGMTEDVPKYLLAFGDPRPASAELRQVLWVAQMNGFGEMWGVCVEDIGEHKAGSVVLRLDNHAWELRASHPSLAEFVRSGPK